MEALTKNQRRYLGRFGCGLCDMPLSRDMCGSIYGPPCSEEVRSTRREMCLQGYRPRPSTVQNETPVNATMRLSGDQNGPVVDSEK